MHTYELVLCIASKYSTRGVVTVGIIDTRHTGYRGVPGTGRYWLVHHWSSWLEEAN